MKVTLAIDSFKGSISSVDAEKAVERGIHRADPLVVCDKFAVSDGGEGLVETLHTGRDELVSVSVHGPLFEMRTARYLRRGSTAVIEMAAASGLTLVPEEKRNPMETTTLGTGELIMHALASGCTRLLIGIGGSATNDGGIGMASGLGYRFLDKEGKSVKPCGKNLQTIRSIDMSQVTPLLQHAVIIAACDIENPLYGKNGAAAVYGPQKGAVPEMVAELDAGLVNLAACSGKESTASAKGSGAAGGLGFGLRAFCNAELCSGIELVLHETGIEESMRSSQLVITGEGRIDSQTGYGKVPAGVAGLAKKYGLPVVAIAGSIGEGTEDLYKLGIDAVVCTTNAPMELSEAMMRAPELIEDAAFRTWKLLQVRL
ncbi:MAG: glycerate kinase [Treponema sp.]|nr:glycerate kinase [Treponema sp.]